MNVPDITESSFWTVTNANDTSVVLGTMDSTNAMWVIDDMQGWFQSPPIQPAIQQLGFRDLSTATTKFPRQARPVSIMGRCFAQTWQDLFAARQRLMGAWGDPNTPFTLTVTEPDVTKQLTRCRLNGQIDCPWEPGTPIVGWYQFSYTIPIIALDPVKYSVSPSTAVTTPNVFGELSLIFPLVRTDGPSLTFPLTVGGVPALTFGYVGGSSGFATVYNTGNVETYPSIEITGPVDNGWYIQNNATGDQFSVNTPVPLGNSLIIDMQDNIALLGGVVVNAQVQGTWFACPVGENDLQYYAPNNDGSEMFVTCYSAWR